MIALTDTSLPKLASVFLSNSQPDLEILSKKGKRFNLESQSVIIMQEKLQQLRAEGLGAGCLERKFSLALNRSESPLTKGNQASLQ